MTHITQSKKCKREQRDNNNKNIYGNEERPTEHQKDKYSREHILWHKNVKTSQVLGFRCFRQVLSLFVARVILLATLQNTHGCEQNPNAFLFETFQTVENLNEFSGLGKSILKLGIEPVTFIYAWEYMFFRTYVP